MTRIEAHAVLDRVVAGENVPLPLIRAALEATGDLSGEPIRLIRRAGTWERTSAELLLLRPAHPFDGLAA